MDYPAYILPMEPKSKAKPFNDSRYLFQVKWDGVRCLSFITGGQVRLQNRRLKDRTCQYPELHALAGLLNGKDAVLDGEIIALKEDGNPGFSRILRRDLAKNPDSSLINVTPVYYLVFDLLFLEEENLLACPFEERQALLKKNLQESERIKLTESSPDGIELFNVVKKRQLEGIVAKKKDAPYRPGEKTEEWLKIKLSRRQDCLIGGYVLRRGRAVSLLLGAYRDGSFLYVGRVSAGLKEAELEFFHREFYGRRLAQPHFLNPPPLKSGEKGIWVEPLLGVAVDFLELTEDLKLRSPSTAGFLPSGGGDWELK